MATVVTVIVIVLILGAAAYLLWGAPGFADRLLPGRARSDGRRLHRRYGREYDRLYAAHGDHAAVESELLGRERERAQLNIVPLSEQDRTRLTGEWAGAQAAFVDDPGGSARRAKQLVGEALALRGYPHEDPERQLALASVDHPESLAEFRDGYELMQRSNNGAVGVDTTEQLRQAMLRFRVFFDEIADGANAPTRRAAKREREQRRQEVAA